MRTTAARIRISRRAAMARLRRKLQAKAITLRKCREGSEAYKVVGEFFTVNSDNYIEKGYADLEAACRDYDVLQPWERLEE